MLERRRIKLVWGASRVIRGHWHLGLFGYYERIEGEPDSGMAISVRGVLAWGGAMATVLYVFAALALAAFWQRNPYSLLTFSDALLYPVRRAEIAQKKGQAFLAEGLQLLKDGQGFDAARLLAQGLALFPQDQRARLALARLYATSNQRAPALALLQAGLTDGVPSRAYLEMVFEIAELAENFSLIVATADRYLPGWGEGRSARDRLWLRQKKFAALLAERRFGEALEFAREEGAGELAAEHQVLVLLELGRAAEAREVLEKLGAQPRADVQLVRRLKVRVWREAGRWDEMARALDEMRELTADDPRTAVYVVVQWAMAGRDERAREAFDDFVFRFGGSAGNVALLATPLAEIAHSTLLERCVTVASESGYPVLALRVLHAEAALRRGEWSVVTAELARLPEPSGMNVNSRERIWRSWMQAVLDAAMVAGESPQVALVRQMRELPWAPKTYRWTIEALLRAGRRETAREIVAIALEAYPASVAFRKQKDEIGPEILPASTGAVPGSRPAVSAGATVMSAPVFFDELDRLLRNRSWVEAASLVRTQRGARPAPLWLDSRDADLRLAEVRIGQGTGDSGAMRAAAGIYLNGDTARSERIIALAREFNTSGDRDAAVALVRTVLRKSPDFAPAQSALAEWEPPAAAGKKS